MNIVMKPGDSLIIQLSDADCIIGLAYSDEGQWIVGTVADTEHPEGEPLFDEELVTVVPKKKNKKTEVPHGWSGSERSWRNYEKKLNGLKMRVEESWKRLGYYIAPNDRSDVFMACMFNDPKQTQEEFDAWVKAYIEAAFAQGSFGPGTRKL